MPKRDRLHSAGGVSVLPESSRGDPVRLLAQPPRALLERLGKETDGALGRKFGLSTTQVRRLRKRLGVDACPAAAGGRPHRVVLTEEQEVLLGVVPDAWLAQRWGVSKSLVLRRRYALGIGPARPSQPEDRQLARLQAHALMLSSSDLSTERIAEKVGVRTSRLRHWYKLWGLSDRKVRVRVSSHRVRPR